MASENSLKPLLRAGLTAGSLWASDALFGSSDASPQDLQAEKVDRRSINGSGPVNGMASLLEAPMSFIGQFFPTAGPDNTKSQGGDNPQPATSPMLKLALAGALLFGAYWFFFRKKG